MICFAPFLAVYYLPHSLSEDFPAFLKIAVVKFHLANPTFHFISPEAHLNAKRAQFFCRKWELRHRGMWKASAHSSAPRSLPQCECRVKESSQEWDGEGEALLCGMSSPSSGPSSIWRKTSHSADVLSLLLAPQTGTGTERSRIFLQ